MTTTCPHPTHKHKRVHAGWGGIVRYEEPCGLPLTADGLCAFHDGPLCDVCSKPLLTRQERRWGRHSGCVTVVPGPEPITAESENAALAWMERQWMRHGGRKGYADYRWLKRHGLDRER